MNNLLTPYETLKYPLFGFNCQVTQKGDGEFFNYLDIREKI